MNDSELNARALTWVKKHKNSFARNLIARSGAEKSDQPAAIFMAGLPGAGKTEFTKNLIKNSYLHVLRLDMDEIAEKIDAYRSDQADKFRKGASLLLSRTFDLAIKGKYSFIMDGTFGSDFALKNVRRAINHDYIVKVIYILQDPLVAWKYTTAREKIEHRAIDADGFVMTYGHIWQNLYDLLLKFGDEISLDVITKNSDNTIRNRQNNVSIKYIDELSKNMYNKDELRKQIDV